MKRIVLFASGSGSNVENIVQYFQGNPDVCVSAVFTNKIDAPVLVRCQRLKVPGLYFNRYALYDSEVVSAALHALAPDLIVLAGFLWIIPGSLVKAFPGRIINIHPALLPKYGGKGMYGLNVHRKVVESGDSETGITIHYVNERYDEGAVIEQVRTNIAPGDTAEQIADKVHALEYHHYPRVIEELLKNG
jgi:phosphoribosylglycinamide formyltransferase-1